MRSARRWRFCATARPDRRTARAVGRPGDPCATTIAGARMRVPPCATCFRRNGRFGSGRAWRSGDALKQGSNGNRTARGRRCSAARLAHGPLRWTSQQALHIGHHLGAGPQCELRHGPGEGQEAREVAHRSTCDLAWLTARNEPKHRNHAHRARMGRNDQGWVDLLERSHAMIRTKQEHECKPIVNSFTLILGEGLSARPCDAENATTGFRRMAPHDRIE